MGWDSVVEAAINIAGGIGDKVYDHNASMREYDRQKEFARSSLQWKVSDARAAGLHPLAAIGASTTPYKPQFVSGSDTFSQMGQSLGRIATENTRIEKLRTENQDLQNQILEEQLRRLKAAPMEGQGNVVPVRDQGNYTAAREGRVQIIPKQIIDQGDEAGKEPGVIQEEQWARTADGGLKPVISQAISEPAESDWFYNLTRMINKGVETAKVLLYANNAQVRNAVWNMRPRNKGEKPGWEWRYNPFKLAFYLKPIGYEGHQEYVQERLWKKHHSYKKQERDFRLRDNLRMERHHYPAPKKYY